MYPAELAAVRVHLATFEQFGEPMFFESRLCGLLHWGQ